MARTEATVDALLEGMSVQADRWMRRLADAIESRDVESLTGLMETVYCYADMLKGLDHDLRLPGEWPERVNEIWNEWQYLRAVAMEHVRRRLYG